MAENQGQNFENTSTDVATLYNNNLGTMRYGYFRDGGFVSISPIFEAYIGREPEPGAKMYNHEKRVFFALNAKDVVRIKEGLKRIREGECVSFSIPHLSRKDNSGKYLTIGGILEGYDMCVSLTELDADGNLKNEVYFAFSNEDSNIILDMDENFGGTEVTVDAEFETFKHFLTSSLMAHINKEGQHGTTSGSNSGGNRQGGNSGGGGQRDNVPGGQRRRRPITGGKTGGAAAGAKNVEKGDAGSLFDEEE